MPLNEVAPMSRGIYTDGLVVDGGPVGLSLAMDLARRGVWVTLAETRAAVEPPSARTSFSQPVSRVGVLTNRLREATKVTGGSSGRDGEQGAAAFDAGEHSPSSEERAAAAEMLRMIWGIHMSQAVYVVTELGIADLLAGGPMSAALLAQATRTHGPSLYRVLRFLASLGVFNEQPDGSFGLTVMGERLRSDVPASMRSWALLVERAGAFRAFEPILETVRTGRSGFELAHGMALFEYLGRHPQRAAGFQAAMSERTAAFAPSVAAGYDFSGMRTIADIGGGSGTLLAAILQAHSKLRGVLFDLPAVTVEARAALHAAGVADRCEVVGGDFFQAVPQDADGYILANVLHDWDDVRAVQILEVCREALAQDGRVLIIERLIPDNLAEAVPVLLSDLTMLVVTGGQERTNPDYERLLSGAGLRLGKIQPVAVPYGVIEGVAQ